MLCRSSIWLTRVCWSGLLLALSGCGRSAVVVTLPEGSTHVDEPGRPVLARGQSDEEDGVTSVFPDDAGGRLLAKMLPPHEPDSLRLPRLDDPLPVVASIRMNPPDLPLPPSQLAMPRLPPPARTSPLRPRLVLDESLDGWPQTLLMPQQQSLPDAGRIRVPSEDVSQPLPLPILSQPVPDRAALDDPTADASTTAALAAPLPMRTTPAPFFKLTLPDPYDHRRVELPVPAEQNEPATGTPKPPRR
jgi:hypothetical protein